MYFKDGVGKWMGTPEALNKASSAKTNAWAMFVKEFPNADRTKFVAQVEGDGKHNISMEIFFKEGPGSLQSVFGSDRKYWSEK